MKALENKAEKLQMLYDIEKSLIKMELRKQRKSAFLIAVLVALGGLAILAANVALYLSIAGLKHYALSACWIIALNIGLMIVPALMLRKHKNSEPEQTIIDIRDALIEDLKQSAELGLREAQQSVEQIYHLGKDIKAFSESGLAVLIPIVKLIANAVHHHDKNKHEEAEKN
ncbi:phage holin family protein [Agaribacterium haliotis]|uniref:phage holin family protein n=1 Tax=Agaribacterium haliotis TaxID=2013869 RepID=UPI000BB573BD|nr:phage holin family protein [Agaribacterium haliotis]